MSRGAKEGARLEWLALGKKIEELHPHEALQAIDICKKVVAGFRLKDAVNRITVVDLVKTMAKLSG